VTRGEKRWLFIGLLAGAAVVAAIYVVKDLREPEIQHVLRDEPPEAAPAPEPADAAAVQLSAEEQKAIGVETVEVKRNTIRREITAPGKVAEPETGIGTISARVGGRIEKLFLKITGETVSRGQPVALIYSPEIFTAAEEYKLALENRRRLGASREAQAITEADELVRASRRRLELWGLTPQQIEDIVSPPERPIEITTYSQVSGLVTKRNVTEGQYVKEGDVLYTVADLSTVWIQADIFEADIPLIRLGESVRITAPAVGALKGTINFLQPSLDPQTRTMMARIQVSNPETRLRPGMFVQVSLETALANNAVAVPRTAVLDTGKERVVYVAKENGIFEKRVIDASSTGDDYYAVRTGVEAGERVVTHGNFLIDSQTRLSGNITGLFGGSKSFGTEAAPAQDHRVTFRSDPAPPKGGTEGMFFAMVIGPDGKPVSDAMVQVTLVMPAMPAMNMGEMRSSFVLSWNGTEYTGSGAVKMAGPWNVTVEARRDGRLLGVYRSRFDAK